MSYIPLHELALFGQNDPQCGTMPTLSAGEQATCCPGTGWVVYDTSESPYGICEKAAAQAGGGAATTAEEPLPTSPLERVEALRARLDAEREAFETQRHQQMLQEMQMRIAAGRVEAQQRAISAARQAKLDAETAKLRAERDAREAAANKELQKKALGIGAALFAAYLILKR